MSVEFNKRLHEVDEAGAEALKSPKLMDLILNGATLNSVSKDVLRGVIRVQAKETAALKSERDVAMRALEMACGTIDVLARQGKGYAPYINPKEHAQKEAQDFIQQAKEAMKND